MARAGVCDAIHAGDRNRRAGRAVAPRFGCVDGRRSSSSASGAPIAAQSGVISSRAATMAARSAAKRVGSRSPGRPARDSRAERRIGEGGVVELPQMRSPLPVPAQQRIAQIVNAGAAFGCGQCANA